MNKEKLFEELRKDLSQLAEKYKLRFYFCFDFIKMYSFDNSRRYFGIIYDYENRSLIMSIIDSTNCECIRKIKIDEYNSVEDIIKISHSFLNILIRS